MPASPSNPARTGQSNKGKRKHVSLQLPLYFIVTLYSTRKLPGGFIPIRLTSLRKQKDRYFRIGLSLSQERETGLEVHRLSQIRINKGGKARCPLVYTVCIHKLPLGVSK